MAVPNVAGAKANAEQVADFCPNNVKQGYDMIHLWKLVGVEMFKLKSAKQ